MRMKIIIWTVMLSVLFLSSCDRQADDLAKMAFQESAAGGYMTIVWEGRTYVPYTSVAKSEMGEKIGYYRDENNAASGGKNDPIYVYEYEGYSPSEWLVDYVDGFMNMPSLWKEQNVTDIPAGLHSDYEWNR